MKCVGSGRSVGSCGVLVIFVHLVGGSRGANGKGPLRDQGTEWEQGAKQG